MFIFYDRLWNLNFLNLITLISHKLMIGLQHCFKNFIRNFLLKNFYVLIIVLHLTCVASRYSHQLFFRFSYLEKWNNMNYCKKPKKKHKSKMSSRDTYSKKNWSNTIYNVITVRQKRAKKNILYLHSYIHKVI